MTNLPASWSAVPIGALCTLINGRAFKPEDWGTDGLPIIRIQNLNNRDAQFNRFAGEVAEKFLVEDGELLFAWSGTPGTSFGAHVWNRGKAILNQHIFRVRHNADAVDRDYFKHAINHRLEELIFKAHGGVGLRHVTKGKFEETEIPLPPLAEQRRIVAKLDQVMARTARARAELARIPALIAHHKRAVLAKSLLEGGGEEVTIGEVAELINGDRGKNYPGDDEQRPSGHCLFLGTRNVRQGFFDFTECQFITKEKHDQLSRGTLERGDIVITIRGTLGNAAVYSDDVLYDHVRINSAMLIVRPTKNIDPYFLMWVLRSPAVLGWFADSARGSAQPHIRATDLESVRFVLPDIAGQREVVRRIEAAFAWLDKVAHEHTQATRLLDHLDQALLAKAFRGELVAQDPADEPAAVLLARIRAEREGAAPAAHKRKARG